MDPSKREVYDSYGNAGNNMGAFGRNQGQFNQFPFQQQYGGNFQHFSFHSQAGVHDFSDIFEEMMGGAGIYGRRPGRQSRNAPKAPPPETEITLTCTLEELYAGASKKLKLTDHVLTPYGGKVQIERKLDIEIGRGWKSGTKIKYPATEQYPKAVVFVVQEASHRYFKRRDDDLLWTCKISESQVAAGFKVKVPLFNGKTLTINSREKEIYDGCKETFKNLGMPRRHARGYGDLIVTYHVT